MDDNDDDGGIFSKPIEETNEKYGAIFDAEVNSAFITPEEDRLRQLLKRKQQTISDLYKEMQESGSFGKVDYLKSEISRLNDKLNTESKLRQQDNEKLSTQLHQMAEQLKHFQAKVDSMEKVFKSNKVNQETGATEIELGGGTRKLNINDGG
jgi:chromosome segregation ATPase